MAQRCLRQLGEENGRLFSLHRRRYNQIYMNDVITGIDNLEEAIRVATEATHDTTRERAISFKEMEIKSRENIANLTMDSKSDELLI